MSAAHPIFDQDRLDELHGIGAMTPEFFGLLSEAFARASQDSIATIERACRAADHQSLHHAAHALKGSAATFGAKRLAARAGEFEVCGRSMSALPPIESVAELRDLASSAFGLACEWASKVGILPDPASRP